MTYQIADTTSDAEYDSYASQEHSFYSQIYKNKLICPFFANHDYQCRKYFPECVTDTQLNTTYVIKICVDTCLRVKDANNGQCQSIGGMSDSFITIECNQAAYYSTPPQCIDVPNPSDGTNTGLYWKVTHTNKHRAHRLRINIC